MINHRGEKQRETKGLHGKERKEGPTIPNNFSVFSEKKEQKQSRKGCTKWPRLLFAMRENVLKSFVNCRKVALSI